VWNPRFPSAHAWSGTDPVNFPPFTAFRRSRPQTETSQKDVSPYEHGEFLGSVSFSQRDERRRRRWGRRKFVGKKKRAAGEGKPWFGPGFIAPPTGSGFPWAPSRWADPSRWTRALVEAPGPLARLVGPATIWIRGREGLGHGGPRARRGGGTRTTPSRLGYLVGLGRGFLWISRAWQVDPACRPAGGWLGEVGWGSFPVASWSRRLGGRQLFFFHLVLCRPLKFSNSIPFLFSFFFLDWCAGMKKVANSQCLKL